MEIRVENLKEKIHSLKGKVLPFLKSEIAKICGVAFLLAFLIVYFLPVLFDNSSLKFQVTRKVGDILGANLSVEKVEVSFLPSPRIILNEAIVQNYKPDSQNLDVARIYNFYADKVTIKLPLFNFSDNFKIKELVFENAIIESYYDNGSADIRDNEITKKIAKLVSGKSNEVLAVGTGVSGELFPISEFKFVKENFYLPQITLINSALTTYDNFGRKREITNISGDLLLTNKKVRSKITFVSDNIASELDAKVRFDSKVGNNDSKIKLSSPILKLNVVGDFVGENKILTEGILASNFEGKIIADIAELKSFYRSYLNNRSLLANRLKYNGKSISVNSDLKIKDGELALENLNIKSTLFDGVGSVNLSKKDKNLKIVDIDFALENLDLDAVWTNEIRENPKSETPLIQAPETQPTEITQTINLDLTKRINNIDLNAEIKAKNVKYLNGQIHDLSLYLTASNEGKILVMPLIFQIPGEATLRLNGAIDNDSANPKFVGKIDGSGKNLGDSLKWLQINSQNLKFENLKDYVLYSNIILLPDSILLNNLYFSLNNNNNEILGELTVKNYAKGANSAGKFMISNFRVDDYFFTSAQNIYLSPGSLLKKLLWLNNLTTSGDFDLKFDKLFYKDEIFKNQNTKFRFRHGFLEVYDMYLNSEKSDLNAKFLVDISEIIPRFNLNISGNKLYYETPQVNFVSKEGAVNETKNRNFFDQIYGLPSIEDFSGKIDINVTDLKVDGLQIDDFKLIGALKDGNINNATSSFKIYSGDFNYSGFLGIKLRKTINGNFTLLNAEITPLLSDIFGIKNIHGVANFSASVTSVASHKDEFLSDLSSEVKFSSRAPYIDGYGLSDLVRKMLYRNEFREELVKPENILLNKNARTVFKQASGNFSISGGQNGRIKIDVSAPAMNAILSGTFEPAKNSLDLLFNAIFITGTSKKQTPINIATSLKGKINEPLESTNIDQVKQYLGLIAPEKNEPKADPKNLLPTQNAVQNPPQNSGRNLDKTILIKRDNPQPQDIPAQNNNPVDVTITPPQTQEENSEIKMFEVPLQQ